MCKVLLVSTLILPLLFVGCIGDPEGKIGPSKWACSIESEVTSGSTARHRYEDVTGAALTQPGIAMSCSGGTSAIFFKSNGLGGVVPVNVDGEQHIESTGITDTGGWCITKGVRDQVYWKHRYIHTTMTVHAPCSPGVDARHKFTTLRPGANWSSSSGSGVCCDPVPASAPIDDDTLSIEMEQSIEDGTFSMPPMAASGSSTFIYGGYTEREYDALTNPIVDPPVNGFEYSRHLIILSGNADEPVYSEVSSLIATNLTDPNDYLRYSAPVMWSILVKTAEPIEVESLVVSCIVSTDAYPDGYEMNLSWYGSSVDNQTLLFRSDPFFLIRQEIIPQYSFLQESTVDFYNRFTAFEDPNIWNDEQYLISVKDDWLDYVDPNEWPDPNYYPVPHDPNSLYEPDNPDFHNFVDRLDTYDPMFFDAMIPERVIAAPIVPLFMEGDYVKMILKEDDLRAIVIAIEHWLTDNRIFDRNGDGIVNLADYVP